MHPPSFSKSSLADPFVPGSQRAPLVCGALGNYDYERVQRAAKALGGGLQLAHQDGESILMIDREPLAWNGSREYGLGWIEGEVWRGGVSEWRQAARRGACGLAIHGRRRFIHSTINGIASIYWIDGDRATYFASRIDALAQASPTALSVDWEAWAAIFALRYPLGERTPFAEISRLAPFSTLHRRFGRSRRQSPTWPWAELEPTEEVNSAATAVVEAFGENLALLGNNVVCPLSGGRDSRILFCILAAARQAAVAVTVSDDEGSFYEENLAAAVAVGLGVPHERISATEDAYPSDWNERARRVEYQFVDHAWLTPLARWIEGVEAPVTDGFAIDVLLQSGNHFFSSKTIEPRRGASSTLYESLRAYGHAEAALTESFQEPIVARAREQFVAAVRSFEGHPSQANLSVYTTRTVRGISNYPSGLLGSGARVCTPGAADPVATACLSVSSHQKLGDAMYAAIFDRLPVAALLPATANTARPGPHLPRRWRSDSAVKAHRRLISDGPLAAHVSPQLQSWLDAPKRGELSADLRIGMETLSLFHAWWSRYRGRLQEVDAEELRKV